MNEGELTSLTEVWEELRFVDDVTGWVCAGCHRVLLRHYVSDCGHSFCHSCQRTFAATLGFRCTHCHNTVLHMVQNEESENKVLNLNVHCLNYKYGCNVVLPLKNLMGHCKVCKDTCRPSLKDLYKSRNPLENVSRQLSSLCQTVRYQNDEGREFSREMLRSVRTSLEELFQNQTQKFQQQISNLDRKMRVLEKQCYEKRAKDQDLAQEIQLMLKNEMDSWLGTISKGLARQTVLPDATPTLPHDDEREGKLKESISAELEEKFKSFQTQILNTFNQQRNLFFPQQQQQQQNFPQKKCLNILLVGESGSGKSTVINAFANYAHYATFADACHGPEVCPIPAKFTYTFEDADGEYKERLIESSSGSDHNEGQPGTLSCRSYVFGLGEGLALRWIDTPGFCSSAEEDGGFRDEEVARDVVSYAGRFGQLHAIAVVIKNNEARVTDKLLYVLQQVLSLFHRSALPHFVFIFSHGNAPKDALPTAKSALEAIAKQAKKDQASEWVRIKNNAFCFQNEAFQNVLTVRAGERFPADGETEVNAAWKANAEECAKLARYVDSARGAHDVSATVKVHEMRGYLRNLNSVIDYLEKRKRAPSLKDIRKPDSASSNQSYKLEAERQTLMAAAAKVFGYIKANAALAKNYKMADYLKAASGVEIDRHVVTASVNNKASGKDGLLLYEDVYETVMKPLLLLDVAGGKLDSLCKVDARRRNPRFNANREVVVSQENNVLFNIM